MRKLTRRDALAGATALGTIVIAGCVAETPGDDATGENGETNDDDAGNGVENGDGDGGTDLEGLALVDSSLETTGSDCSSPHAESAELSIDGTTASVVGTSPAPNPCHECILESATLDGQSLSLVVGIADTTEDDEGCVQCAGEVDYVVTCEFSEELSVDAFDSVTVTHEHGETHTLVDSGSVVEAAGEETVSENSPAVVDYSIEAVDGGGTGSHDVGDSEAKYDYSGQTVTIDGWMVTSTPCYEPVIFEAAVEDGTLSVDVGARSTSEQGEVCQQVISKLSYQATVTLADEVVLDAVSITHGVPSSSDSVYLN